MKLYDRVEEDKWLYNKGKRNEGFKNLIKYITKDENILLAVHSIKNNKGSKTPGIDGKNITDIMNMDKDELIDEIKMSFKKYNKTPVKRVYIPKANGKERPLGIPIIKDRIIQQCVLQVLNPIFESKFSKSSHGFRKGRGVETSLSQLYRMIQRQNLHYAVRIDIERFYEEVNHRKLRQIMYGKGIKDKKLLKIIDCMLKSGVVDKGVIYRTDKGLMQGGVLSPLLSNIYLNELDNWIDSQWKMFKTRQNYETSKNKQGEPVRTVKYRKLRETNLKEMYIVRYADDFIVMCSNYKDAERAKLGVSKWLKDYLKLEINEDKSRVVNLKKNKVDFIGFDIGTQYKNNKYKVKSNVSEGNKNKIVENSKKLLKEVKRKGNKNRVYDAIVKYNATVIGWHNYFRYATHVSKDFGYIRQRNYWYIETSLRGMQTNPKKGSLVGMTTNYSSKQIKYLMGIPILPIGEISTKTPRDARDNFFEQDKILDYNDNLLERININSNSRGFEYSENRVQKFILQNGKCYITNRDLQGDEIHCHHIKPVAKKGDNSIKNLVILDNNIHRLLHKKDEEEIKDKLTILNLNKKQINKFNKLRKELELSLINI